MAKTYILPLYNGIYRATDDSTVYLVRVVDSMSKECIIPSSIKHYEETSKFWLEWGTYKLASTEECAWLQACIRAGTRVEKPKILEYQIF